MVVVVADWFAVVMRVMMLTGACGYDHDGDDGDDDVDDVCVYAVAVNGVAGDCD